MRAPVLIVGQGLAGTALGLELEEAGVPFVVVSEGHDRAASRVAAGLINPVTGQRFVKPWRFDTLRPLAESAYRRWGRRLGTALWHDVALERGFADEVERRRAQRKFEAGELAPWSRAMADDALVLDGAAWVDLPALLGVAARRWRESGILRETTATGTEFEFPTDGAPVRWRGEDYVAVVCCTGAGVLARAWFADAGFAVAKGEILSVCGAGIVAGRVRQRGHWLLGEEAGQGRIGATFVPGAEDWEPTVAAREALLASARALADGPVEVAGHVAGVRLSLPDRLPGIGWHPARPGLGFFGALGAKGALWAPWLAALWREALVTGQGVPAEVDVARGRRFAATPDVNR